MTPIMESFRCSFLPCFFSGGKRKSDFSSKHFGAHFRGECEYTSAEQGSNSQHFQVSNRTHLAFVL